jgi:hypothetical protein
MTPYITCRFTVLGVLRRMDGLESISPIHDDEEWNTMSTFKGRVIKLTHYDGGELILSSSIREPETRSRYFLYQCGPIPWLSSSLLRNMPAGASTFADFELKRGIHVCYTIRRIRRPNGGFRKFDDI